MAQLIYVPKLNVIPGHVSNFINETPVSLNFKMSSAPSVSYKVNSSTVTSLSGRRCTNKNFEELTVSFNTSPVCSSQEAQWWEFIRSTSCEEKIRLVSDITLPGECLVRDEAYTVEPDSPQVTNITKHLVSVSFTLRACQLIGAF
ncbi:hypothetical protein AB833_19490 [Chromatiales bacterium (ex Bugula neritina AB1)]|nr:hypothetical protein AB833_19490 [Chromatiales bacterium (ex Bugula neritina AB1)]